MSRRPKPARRSAETAHGLPRRADLHIAAAGGVFLVLGALIAGGFTAYSTKLLQDHETRREQQHLERESQQEAFRAQGAARLLFAELLGAASQMAILGGDHVLRHFDRSYRVEMRPSDLRLIASWLEPEQWGSVQQAIVSAEGLETFVNTQLERGRLVLTKGEACYIRHDVRNIYYAADALRGLAAADGTADAISDPKPIRCKPGPGPVPPELRTRLEAADVPIIAPKLAPGETLP